MSPRKSQKKFSAVPKTAKKPTATAGVQIVSATTPQIEPVAPITVVTPVMAEVTEVVEATQPTEVPVVASPIAEVVTTPVAEVVAATAPCRTTELVAALGNLDADVARDAAAELGSLKDLSAVGPLVGALTNVDGFTHPVVRAAAAASLGQLGDVTAVEPLIAAIGDSMAEASAEAIRALAVLGDARAVPALIEVVRNASGFYLPTIRRAAVGALGQLGGPLAVAELRVVAADSWEDSVIRDAAAEATKNVSLIEGTQA